MRNFANNPRLPVTEKPVINHNNFAYVYSSDPSLMPGPVNIYAPNMIQVQTAKPPLFDSHPNTYLPPYNIEKTTSKPISNTYLPPYPVDKNPDNTYLPPKETNNNNNNNNNKPNNTYLPPKEPENIYLPPKDPNNIYLPPTDSEAIPPPIDETDLLPPEESTCQSLCCNDSVGKFVIPVPLKSRENESKCGAKYAQLILPIKAFDSVVVEKLKEILPKEKLDTDELLRNILENLL
jgi:hypothetical protein